MAYIRAANPGLLDTVQATWPFRRTQQETTLNARPLKDRETIALDLTPDQVIAWRERLHYSQRDAAHALGCSRDAWARWEKGTKQVPLYIALAMAALAMGLRPYGEVRS
jgi:DNA-binding XRE family transcriptional regulator